MGHMNASEEFNNIITPKAGLAILINYPARMRKG